MGRLNRNDFKKNRIDKINKYSRFLAVPLVVLVLILVIILGDRKSDESQTTDAESIVLSSEVLTPDGESQAGGANWQESSKVSFDLSDYPLTQDGVPELTALVQSYCQAKLDVDAESLERVFGRSGMSEEELEEEREKMELVRQMVDGYENISCYSTAGLEPDTYVIYPYFEVQYKGAEAAVPYVMWSYARKDDSGQFYMTQNVSDNEREHIARVSQSEAVKELADRVRAREEELKNSDKVLKQIYQIAPSEDGEKSFSGSHVEIIPGSAVFGTQEKPEESSQQGQADQQGKQSYSDQQE